MSHSTKKSLLDVLQVLHSTNFFKRSASIGQLISYLILCQVHQTGSNTNKFVLPSSVIFTIMLSGFLSDFVFVQCMKLLERFCRPWCDVCFSSTNNSWHELIISCSFPSFFIHLGTRYNRTIVSIGLTPN